MTQKARKPAEPVGPSCPAAARVARQGRGSAGRRQWLRLLPVLAWAGWWLPARAHHGFQGKYDVARPMFLQGTLLQVQGSLPHVHLVVKVPRGGGRVPRGREWMRPLEDAEARPTLSILSPFERWGRVELTLDWRLSRAVLEDPALLLPGDPIAAVVYRRTAKDEYRGELLVVLLRTSDGQVLVSARPPG